MTSRRSLRVARVVTTLSLLSTLSWAGNSAAQGSDAGAYFRRGVELYNEANYSGALAEFKRAYALAPTSAALFDVGETQFQLQDYAAAIHTFRKFLAEFGPGEPHHAEVEANVQLLATRVAHLRIVTVPSGADIAVDEDAVGATALADRVLINVGHRKVVASMAGRLSVTRFVDVAGGDDITLNIELPPTTVAAPVAAPAPRPMVLATPRRPVPVGLRQAGWITTGVLAAAAATFGALAIHEADQLDNARHGLTTRAVLDHDASLTTTFAILADSLGAAAVAVGGLSLYWTLSASASDGHEGGSGARSHLQIGATSARFELTF